VTGTADPDQGGARGSPGPGTGSAGPGTGSAGPGTGSAGPAAVAGGPAGPADPEPDARFTFANERTFLAWSRTGLALIVAGLGIVQLLPPFPGVPWGRHLIGVPLIVLGAIVAVAGYVEWVRNQRALRRGEPVPRSFLPVILTVTITAVAVISAVVLLISAVR
jgi:putative membrane protein